MQWDGSVSAGFTTGRPWLPLEADHDQINVATLMQNRTSILHLYRKLIDLRRIHPTLVSGKIQCVVADRNVLRYERVGDKDRILVLLNMGADPVPMTTESGTVLASTDFDRDGQKMGGTFEMKGAEGLIIDLDP
jgi:alpha-glucosidase